MFSVCSVTGNNMIRRALLAFDLSAIPEGATITSAQLTLNMSQTSEIAPLDTFSHRVLKDWGEGTSQAGRGEGAGAPATIQAVTWLHTFFASGFWDTPGGDFMASPSAMAEVSGLFSDSTFPHLRDEFREPLQCPAPEGRSRVAWGAKPRKSVARQEAP